MTSTLDRWVVASSARAIRSSKVKARFFDGVAKMPMTTLSKMREALVAVSRCQ